MIRQVIAAMIRDCRSRDLTENTIEYYEYQCEIFAQFCEDQGVVDIERITPDLIRQYLIQLQELGHSKGGIHAKYRAMKTLLLWYEREYEPEEWNNPIHKIRPPKVPEAPVEPITIEQVKLLLDTCDNSTQGLRDRALILFLLDTGVRVAELCALNSDDVDMYLGRALIRETKTGQPRFVYIGRKTTKAVRSYSRRRDDSNPALWVTSTGERLAIKSVQTMLYTRCNQAGIPPQSPHDFRKAFSTIMSRVPGVDVFNLMLLTGHKSIEVLRKHYIAKEEEAAKTAHERGSPVDRLL